MTPETALDIREIFASIQGESTWAGAPCAFVRLAGCNLRCAWCDTEYAQRSGGAHMSIGAILDEVNAFGLRLAEITGGEPLVQEGTPALAAALLEAGYIVLAETNGSLPIGRFPAGVHRIVDFKSPSSGETAHILWDNIAELRGGDEVKFVLADRADYEWARGAMLENELAKRCAAVLFSAVHGRLDAAQLAAWLLEDRLPARLNLQLHKILWPAALRGV